MLDFGDASVDDAILFHLWSGLDRVTRSFCHFGLSTLLSAATAASSREMSKPNMTDEAMERTLHVSNLDERVTDEILYELMLQVSLLDSLTDLSETLTIFRLAQSKTSRSLRRRKNHTPSSSSKRATPCHTRFRCSVV